MVISAGLFVTEIYWLSVCALQVLTLSEIGMAQTLLEKVNARIWGPLRSLNAATQQSYAVSVVVSSNPETAFDARTWVPTPPTISARLFVAHAA